MFLITILLPSLFSRFAKITVSNYIKKRRLTIAARKISEKMKTITEIAFTVGYKYYEQFSRDFKEEFSLSPNEYRKSGTSIVFTPKLDFKLMKTVIGENETIIFDQMSLCINVINIDEIYAVGISKLCGLTKGLDDPGILQCYFNDEMKNKIPNQVNPPIGLGIGITNYICDDQPHGFTYIASRQVTSLENVPSEFTKYTVPSGMYAVCTVEAENFDLLTNEVMYKAGSYMLNVWLSEQNPKYKFICEMTIERYYPTDKDGVAHFDYYFPIIRK